MGFREMIRKVQGYSGFSDDESKDALECMIESLSVHLNEGARKNFASQLPEELQDIALAVLPTEENSHQDMIQQFMENQHIDEKRARKQILSAWQTLKDAIKRSEIERIRAQLPNRLVAFLR